MSQLRFISYDNMEMLKSGVKFNISNYASEDNSWISEYLKSDNFLLPSKIEYEGLELEVSNNPEKDDLQNCKKIFEVLKSLTPSQACDERIWVAMTHGILWNYMQRRWPLSKGSKDQVKYINKNYFFAHGEKRSLMTNAISKLWWIAYLTYDEENENPYLYTEYIYKDINGRGFPLFGSNFSNNRELLKLFLKATKKYEDTKRTLSREQFLTLIKMMNLWGGKIIMETLPYEEIENMLFKHIDTKLF